MAKPRTVAEYIAAQPPATRKVLTGVRRALRAALPGAEDIVSYGIPALAVDGRAVVYYSAWKTHVAIYPAPRDLTGLERYRHGKGTLRFALDEPPSDGLVKRIAKRLARDRPVHSFSAVAAR